MRLFSSKLNTRPVRGGLVYNFFARQPADGVTKEHIRGMGKIKAFFSQLDFSWRSLGDYGLIIVGGFVQALALRTFLVPAQLVSGGVSGVAQLLHYLMDWPIGLVTLLANIPLFIIGWRYLGGPRFAIRTILTVVSYTVFTDILIEVTGTAPITDDILLNTLYGGIVLGLGLGLVDRKSVV